MQRMHGSMTDMLPNCFHVWNCIKPTILSVSNHMELMHFMRIMIILKSKAVTTVENIQFKNVLISFFQEKK